MRRRKNRRSDRVFVVALLSSALVHAVLGIPARSWLNQYLSSKPREAEPPVKLVTLSPEQWSKNRQVKRRRRRSSAAVQARKAPAPKPKQQKKKENSKLNGQVVEVPPTKDDRPNPDAKFLSKHNTRVKKETTARPELRDRNRKRVTNKLQKREAQPKREKSIPTPSTEAKGSSTGAKKKGQGTGKGTDKGEFVLELPSLRRRNRVLLPKGDNGVPVPREGGQDQLNGKGKRYRLQLGGAGNAPVTGGQAGKKSGAKRPLPSLESLRPTIGTIARISGSPSNDYVPNVPEGDGTFLNSKEFKYATFFYRVKDSVGNIWYDMVLRELRRRDPTGNIYGPRDRATLLSIRLKPDGRLAEVRVANSSGVQFLDDVAVQAFKMAEPFPNPPTALADDDGFITFNFQFVMLRSRGPLNLFNFR